MKRINIVSTLTIIGVICFIILILGDEDCGGCYSPEVMLVKLFFCGFVIMIVSLYFARKYKLVEKIIFRIENQPLLETNEATEGVSFAGHGKIYAKRKIKSKFKKVPCVYYHSILEKWIKRQKNSTWKVVENEVRFVPFYLEDDRGKLLVDITNIDSDFSKHKIKITNKKLPNPRHSEIDCDVVLKRIRFNVDEKSAIKNLKKGKYRKTEYILKPGTNVFVYGHVGKYNKQLALQEHNDYPLIISKKTQRDYVNEFYKGKKLIFAVHGMVLFGYLLSLFSIKFVSPNLIPYYIFIALIIGGVVIIGGSVIFTIFNRIITLKNRALNALSNIDGELLRRNDLIPNLEQAVKKYAKYEKEVQAMVAELRTKRRFSDKLDTKKDLPHHKLIGLIEKYPEIKNSELVHKLMINLVDSEERIAYSREFYNRTVRKYNTLIQQFPFVIVATLTGCKDMKFINLD